MNIRERISSLGEDQVGIVYIGQAGFLLSFGRVTAAIDPYLSYSVDRAVMNSDWTRNYAPPFLPSELDFIDYIFLSHDHMDHADPETIALFAECSDAQFLCGGAIAEKVRKYGAKRLVGMREDVPFECRAFSVKLIPAAHEEIHRNRNGECEECGFLFDFNGISVYHSGDSLVYEGLTEAITGTDVMLLPVNGHGFFRRYVDDCIGNMDAYDASRLAKAAKAKLMVPMHYDLYPGNSVPCEAVSAIISAAAPNLDFRLPKPGMGWKITQQNEKITVENF